MVMYSIVSNMDRIFWRIFKAIETSHQEPCEYSAGALKHCKFKQKKNNKEELRV